MNNFTLRLFISALVFLTVTHSQANPVNLPPAANDNDFYFDGKPSTAKVKLGQMLFFDKILSGNQNISCATCHHALTGSGDGLSLSVGEGGQGLGVTRDTGNGASAIHERVPRNAPPIFNLGAKEFSFMFHDGRVAIDTSTPSGYASPAGNNLPLGLDNVLAVQAMFPVTSPVEMAGQVSELFLGGEPKENLQAVFALNGDYPRLWRYIANKLRTIPEYVSLFKNAYDDVSQPQDITFVHAANAIAAFEAVAWRFDDSPFDRSLRGAKGNRDPLSKIAKRGAALFYGKAKCDSCHSGTFQTDQQFHAIAIPQIGPGKGDGNTSHEDFGRERVTGERMDRFKFRTPSLRNIALTAPYGHDGAYNTLRGVVEHHLDSINALYHYNIDQAALPPRNDLNIIDGMVMQDEFLVGEIAAANEIAPIQLSTKEVDAILYFLHALTDTGALDLRHTVPYNVPSNLPVWD